MIPWRIHPYSFAGLPEVYELFMMDLAGASEIPAARLFGRSPQGMNATGESDLKIYYEKIGQLQETYLRPALEKLLPVLEISAIGYFSPDSEIVFEPIATTTPAERVTILSQLSASVTSMVQAGLITKDSALAELRSMGRELGAFSHLEPAGIRPGLLLSFPRMRNLPRSHFNLYDDPACLLSNMYGRLVFIFCSPQKHLPKPPFIVYDCSSYCSVSTYRSLFPARSFWLLLGGDPTACAE